MRRYSDFTWLSGELSREFPGVIVPPLPEKLTVGRFGDEFVESRRRSLEKFLQRVAAHSELSNSQHFIVFLQAAESGLAEAKNESKSVVKAKSGNPATNAVSWFEGTVNTLTVGKVHYFSWVSMALHLSPFILLYLQTNFNFVPNSNISNVTIARRSLRSLRRTSRPRRSPSTWGSWRSSW